VIDGIYTGFSNITIRVTPLKAELLVNPICHLLALLGGATIVVVSRLRVNNQLDALFYCVYFTSLHVSSNPVLIIRRINCINTSSFYGIHHDVLR